tara:strand:+ start:82 stop:543 length:462 start_codon:yes stop_codon:yes gene_type:complete
MHKLLTILAFLLIGSVANAEENKGVENILNDIVKTEIKEAEETYSWNDNDSLTFSEQMLIRKGLKDCISYVVDNVDTKVPSLSYYIEWNADGSVLKLSQTNIFDYGMEDYYEVSAIVTKLVRDCKIVANPSKHKSWNRTDLTIDLADPFNDFN